MRYKFAMAVSATMLLGFTLFPTGTRAEDEQPVGVVEQPENVIAAPTGEAASDAASQGFDTPYSSQGNDGAADDLQPRPTEAAPNN